MTSKIEWLKSGPDTWTARSNAYVITVPAGGLFEVRDGHGRVLADNIERLSRAKAFAQTDQDRNAR
jgi:hypothetical protein